MTKSHFMLKINIKKRPVFGKLGIQPVKRVYVVKNIKVSRRPYFVLNKKSGLPKAEFIDIIAAKKAD